MRKLKINGKRYLDGLIEPGTTCTVNFQWPKPAISVMRKRKRVRPSIWTEQHRVVTMSSIPGQWRNDVAPYLAGIIDVAFVKKTRKVIVCKAPQTGMTECGINAVCYAIDRAPGPTLFVFPDRDMARENAMDRIAPAIKESPIVAEYLTGDADDVSANRINLIHMPIYMAWAHSASKLANKPIMYLVLDEVDKYPATSGKKETSPILLAEARVTTYPDDHKVFMFSSPTTEDGNVWRAMTEEAQVVGRYEARCIHCRHEAPMEIEDIKIPENERDPGKVKSELLARYVCKHCGGEWNDQERNRAVLGGKWVAWHIDVDPDTGEWEWSRDELGRELRRYVLDEGVEKVGFHLPSWLSRFVSMSTVMASFLTAQGDKTTLKDFNNKHCAVPWRHMVADRPDEAILSLQDDRPRSLVPGGGKVAALVAGIDTQDNGFYYTIWAVGWAVSSGGVPTSDFWLVREGFVLTFEDLSQVLWGTTYRDASGVQYPVQLTLQDSGGHRTGDVYMFCAGNPGIMAAKGERTMAQRYSFTDLEFLPGTRKRLPGAPKLVRINTTLYKDALDAKLRIVPGDPGGVHLYNGGDGKQNSLADFAAQMCAEVKDEQTGYWAQVASRANHYWDCAVLALCAADVLRVSSWQKPPERKQAPAARKEQKKAENPYTGGRKLWG